ncbi:MAG TPA: YcxB family protein [Thermoguttaceae bacterium]|nr:YcxB family protein [Thermoguttaceae bacterium]
MDDEHEPPINPYQSPRADLDAEEYFPGPDRVYGLEEPIRIQGKLSAEDYQEKETTSEKIKMAFSILLLLVGIAIIGVYLGIKSPSPTGLSVFAIGGGLIALSAWLLVLFANRSFRKHVDRNGVVETTTFAEGGIVAEAEEGRGEFLWSAFCGCKCSEHRVLLYLEPNGDHLIYPKRFFASEADWNRFLGLVRCKVPEGGDLAQGRPGDPPAAQTKGGPTPLGVSRRQGEQPLLRVAGALTWRDWKEVRRRTGKPWMGRLARVGCLLPFVIVGATIVLWRGTHDAWLGLIGPGGAGLVFFCLLFVWPAVKLRRQWKRGEPPFGPYEIRIWDDALDCVEASSVATVPWTAFDRFTRSESLLLLHQDKLRVFRFIPRSFFSSDEAWQTLLRLVRDKLPEGGQETATQR